MRSKRSWSGICKVTDDNAMQGMQQAQVDKIDDWAFYKVRDIRQKIAKSTLVQLKMQELLAILVQQALAQF